MSDTPVLPPTPVSIRKHKDLPLDSETEDDDSELPPLDIPSSGGLGPLGLALQNEELSGLTPAQLYDMNQDLYNDSVPTRPLIDTLAPMTSLRQEYENGSVSFVKQIDWLMQQGFNNVRRTRGDGDCFYRCDVSILSLYFGKLTLPHLSALGFAYVESLINSIEKELAVGSSLSILEGTKSTLNEAGIEQLVYEDFYDDLTTLIQRIVKPGPEGQILNSDLLLEAFQAPEVSNSIVMYLRLLTSAQIRLNREAYDGFLVHPDTKDIMDVDSFCNNVVQAMGKEADNVEIEALCRALQLNVDLAYLNGGKQDEVDFIKFRNDSNEKAQPLILLYRPGHYDILIRRAL